MEADIVRQMYHVKLDDVDTQSRLIHGLQLGKAVSRYLWLAIQDGVKASEEIQLRGKRID